MGYFTLSKGVQNINMRELKRGKVVFWGVLVSAHGRHVQSYICLKLDESTTELAR